MTRYYIDVDCVCGNHYEFDVTPVYTSQYVKALSNTQQKREPDETTHEYVYDCTKCGLMKVSYKDSDRIIKN